MGSWGSQGFGGIASFLANLPVWLRRALPFLSVWPVVVRGFLAHVPLFLVGFPIVVFFHFCAIGFFVRHIIHWIPIPPRRLSSLRHPIRSVLHLLRSVLAKSPYALPTDEMLSFWGLLLHLVPVLKYSGDDLFRRCLPVLLHLLW